MVFKTQKAFAICSSNNVLNVFGAPPAHHTPITSPPSHYLPSASSPRQTISRYYATGNENKFYPTNEFTKPGHSGKTGGPSWPSCVNPTPYDIFDLDKAAPYNKARFAELVKQYHPDRHHASALDSLPSQTRLERYRLVVLANEILSSPDKRRAYDAVGANWHMPGAGMDDSYNMHEAYRQADKAWRYNRGNPAANATWEDWERWHDRGAERERQRPLYMSNSSFAALVFAALAMGTVVQTTRMENSSAYILDKRQAYEANISEALRRQGEATAGKGREERIERFLRERENISFDFMPSQLEVRRAPSAES